MKKWTRVLYQPNLPLEPGKYVTAGREHIELSKQAAAEGMVLLKNSGNLLPLAAGSRIALFGKGSFDYVKGGGGSGDVTVSYVRNLYEGLKMQGDHVSIYEPLSDFYRGNVEEQYAKGAVPGMTREPEIEDSLFAGARAFADIAIISISRFSGEGWDRSNDGVTEEENLWEPAAVMQKRAGEVFPRGDFYLTEEEERMIGRVKEHFEKIVVTLNVGGVVDTSWFADEKNVSAVLLTWQGGMEGGLAAAELLCGKANPSGKLPDTFAARLEDYPSTGHFHDSPRYVDYTEDIYVGYRYFETIPGAAGKVCYPFGFGLSYTQFSLRAEGLEESEDQIRIPVTVTNIGGRPGKEVVQSYYSAPQGVLGKPGKALGAFAKTRELKPGESQMVFLDIAKYGMASYDDTGKILKSAYVLEAGTYEFYVGNSVRDGEKLPESWSLAETRIVQKLSPKLTPAALRRRMRSDGSYEELPVGEERDPDACMFEKMKPGTEEGVAPEVRGRERQSLLDFPPRDRILFSEVAEGKASLEEFAEQLEDGELLHLLGGQPNTGTANTFGIGNLPEYGVPNAMTADGPAGLRIAPECGVHTTAWPCATLLASSWNTEITEQVGRAAAREVKENNIAVWLAPAVNIHRNPMCGRNFEYFSEDPYLTGKLAAAMVKGIESQHISSCVKHFACNNKETNRKNSDSRVSERALREIYLKAFEIIVKEAKPWSIMSSYNAINGCRASESRELLEGILREEWGYEGLVLTDWWNRGEHYKEILAGNDVKMATGYPDRVAKAMEAGVLGRSDLKRSAERVLDFLLKID